MACCGAVVVASKAVVNEPREGAVLVCPQWGGLRNYWGMATGTFYGRVSNALLLWVDAADLVDPQLARVDLPTEEPQATTEPAAKEAAARKRGR